jgi:hypothetical protein
MHSDIPTIVSSTPFSNSVPQSASALEVPELIGLISPEWEDNWWKKKLHCPVDSEILDMFYPI